MEECKKRPVCILEPCHGMVWYEQEPGRLAGPWVGRQCSCDPVEQLFSTGCVHGGPQLTLRASAQVAVCRVTTSP